MQKRMEYLEKSDRLRIHFVKVMVSETTKISSFL